VGGGMICDPTTYPFGYFCIEKNVNISTLVTVTLFILGYVVARVIDRHNKRVVRKKYLVALLQEIDVNIEALKKTFDGLPPPEALAVFLNKGLLRKRNRPLITVTYTYVVFESHTAIIMDLDNALITTITKFYGHLDTIKTDVASVESKAFETISLAGRNALFAHLRTTMGAAIEQGKNSQNGIAMYLRLVR